MALAADILEFVRPVERRSDRSLVRDAQSGKPDAAAALVERYYPRIHSFVNYFSPRFISAEDMTQEVFTRALAALGRFNGNYRVESWLLRIARNLCIDEARRRPHHPEPVDPITLPDLEPAPVAGDKVWDSVSQALAAKAIKAALEKLPERQRMVLILREIEGMSYSAIAEMAGTNVRGVEATLRRARARFRMAIADAEASEGRTAVCKQTLRLIANDTSKTAVATHLDGCADCKERSEKIRAADRAFGLLPPLALARPSWLGKVVGLAPKPARRPKSFLQSLRGAAEVGFVGPVSQILQAITSVALAGALSVSSALGGAARVALVVNGSPPPELTTIEQLAASVESPAHPQPPPSHPVVAVTDLTYDHRLQQGDPETKDNSVVLDTPATAVSLDAAFLPVKASLSISSTNISAAIGGLTPDPLTVSAKLPATPLPIPTIPKIPDVSATIASVLPRRKFAA